MSSVTVVLRARLLSLTCGFVLSVLPQTSGAQERPDAAQRLTDTVAAQRERKPPLSPARAFLYSLVLPGYSQTVLGRNRAAALEIAFESMALVMWRISAADLREVRRNRADSIPVSFVSPSGVPGIQWQRTQFNEGLVRARRAHVEDWIAVLAGNHLFSALDAYVASMLWDLPAEVAVRVTPREAGFALRLHW